MAFTVASARAGTYGVRRAPLGRCRYDRNYIPTKSMRRSPTSDRYLGRKAHDTPQRHKTMRKRGTLSRKSHAHSARKRVMGDRSQVHMPQSTVNVSKSTDRAGERDDGACPLRSNCREFGGKAVEEAMEEAETGRRVACLR
jgi:hypothetical protein